MKLRQTTQWKELIRTGGCDGQLAMLYGTADVAAQRARYVRALAAFEAAFGMAEAAIVSAPGRSEIGGNHTDHQRGRVLAAAASLDMLAVVSPRADDTVRLRSEGYPMMQLCVRQLEVRTGEFNTSKALVRGILAWAASRCGALVHGFDVYVCSDVPKGSGLSSSAAFGILIGNLANGLYLDGAADPVELAQAAQFSENRYFNKPSGLMDELAASVGGFVSIDFFDCAAPEVERIPCDFDALGYAVCIINAGGSHANLTQEYADIPRDMRRVAALFGCEVLSEVAPEAFFASLGRLREQVDDRALLRAIHFFEENVRVPKQAEALRRGDAAAFLSLVRASGRSSFMQLQNVCPQERGERSLALALAVAERALSGRGAARVHGGGFAGTIQAFVPQDAAACFVAEMEAVFGEGCCYRLRIRPVGGYALTEE